MKLRHKLLLGGLFGVLMGVSYAPFPTGIFAFVAFIPLLIVYEQTDDLGSLLRFSYYAFFVYNLITLYWPGGFIHGKDTYLMMAGGILLLAHPMFYFVPIVAWHLLRKGIGFVPSLVLFPACWVGFEYLDSLTDFAFPWLTIGTTQAGNLSAIQFATVTGVYGISFWILGINVGIFLLGRKLASREWDLRSPRAIMALVALLACFSLPHVYGNLILSLPDLSVSGTFRIGIIQPNIDPFEKWERESDPQLGILQRMTDTLARLKPDLILWPETAVPMYLLDPRNARTFNPVRRQVDTLGVPLLAGIPDIVYYADSLSAPPGSKRLSNGVRYETFNGSMLLRPNEDTLQKYAKMLLVPFAERVPYSDVLEFLNAAKWNFGLGGWNRGRDATVFEVTTKSGRPVRFSTMICYESIFPGFVASFVRNGAEFLSVLTNDSWWGNSSGPYQHVEIEVLRAVENRRWLVQCSNGGISCVIDPLGRVHHASPMFTRKAFVVEVEPSREMTVYAAYGDWFVHGCSMLTVLALVAGSVRRIHIHRKERGTQ